MPDRSLEVTQNENKVAYISQQECTYDPKTRFHADGDEGAKLWDQDITERSSRGEPFYMRR